MADKILSITDGTITKRVTLDDDAWDDMVRLYARWGNTLADTEAELTFTVEKLNREIITFANKYKEITGGTGATKYTAGSVS
jgi:hypothetical protein|tara:strand:+ start:188 stop:433 length:246 start_codon:yes stop_codon:yes gene_type:complete